MGLGTFRAIFSQAHLVTLVGEDELDETRGGRQNVSGLFSSEESDFQRNFFEDCTKNSAENVFSAKQCMKN
jgi:hypothetical protein